MRMLENRAGRLARAVILGTGLALACSFWGMNFADAQAPVPAKTTVTLLNVNDIYEITASKNGGGFAELATLIKAERKAAKNSVLTVSGDFLSPSIMSGLTKGAHMISLFNELGVNYISLGNHEFDFGPDILNQRIKESKAAWVNSNVMDKSGKILAGTVPTAILEADGFKIGMFGLLTEETTTLSSPGSDIAFVAPAEAASQAVVNLKEQGAEVIVALTHMTLEEDRELARKVKDIHVILGGHDHDPISFFERSVLISKAGYDGHFLGVTELEIQRVEGKNGPEVLVRPVSWRFDSTVGVTPDPEMAKAVKVFTDKLDQELNIVIGTSKNELDSRRATVRGAEAAIGNLIADAMREGVGADLAITNGGGIRADKVYPAGTALTRKDILAELPFGNVTVLMELTGAQVRDALENGVSKVEEGAGRFPQVSGLSFSYDAKKPAGSRVTEVKVGGAAIDPAKTYKVATNDYMAGGGDGYETLKQGKILIDASGATLMATQVMNYIEAKKEVSPSVEGRIIRIE